MRVLVTGARGFVGHWLTQELELAGHEALAPRGRSELDVTDAESVRRALAATPDAVVHLAAVAFAPDASAEPGQALRTNVGGTVNVLEGVRELPRPPAVLVTGSSEVYGPPNPSELPLTEESTLRPRTAYALSKIGQEGVALAYARRYALPVVATRSFNHSGPGQRPVFVVPALAGRVLAVRQGREPAIRVGNVTVRRDFLDVRDVVRAYRLLIEALAHDRIGRGGAVFNVASGRAVAIGDLIEQLCKLAGVAPRTVTDPALVRSDDPPEIRGDSTALRSVTGWQPESDVSQMLASVWEETLRTASEKKGVDPG